MTARTARKARAASRNQKRAEVNAQKRGAGEVATVPKPANDREKTGLEWLVHKRRISTRQAMAGRHYGEDWRVAQLHGSVPLRSCLNDAPGGSGAASRSLPAVEYQIEACERLVAAQEALSYQVDMIKVLGWVCGREFTPWQALGEHATQKEVARIEAILGIALDLLDKHYRAAR